ncbi:MAG: DUF4064 domain-containing protein [Gemella sp.]|nr:DUF4064 domain-containing protein [Gemella sp.]
MKRTWEKVLAWFANIILILISGLLSLVTFSGALAELNSMPEFKEELQKSLLQNTETSGLSADQLMASMELGLKVATGVGLITLVIALIASFTMKKRILSGILFLVAALVITVGTFAVGWFIGLLYLVVAIMLFVRKEPKKDDPFDPENPENRVDEIKYI